MLLSILAIAAVAPMPGQTYEGTSPIGKSRGPVTLVVSRNGARVERLSFGFERGCRRAGKRLPQPGYPSLRRVRIRNGRFTWRESLRYPSTGGWQKTIVKGRFLAGGTRFSATIRQRMHNPQTKIRCDSGTVRFGGAIPERALVNGAYAGQTAQGKPLTLTIKPEGVTAASVDVVLTCTNGEQIVRTLAPLEEPGRVSSDDLTFRASDYKVLLSGTASRERVTGIVSSEDWISRPDGEDGEETYSCASGNVPFEARRSS